MHSPARLAVTSALWLLAASTVSAQTTAAPSSTKPAVPSITAVSDCHPHSTVNWCMVGTDEYQVVGPTRTEEMEAKYTDCHHHSTSLYCVDSKGEDVQILIDAQESTDTHDETEEHNHDHDTNTEPAGSGQHCHDHAGIPHCVGGSAESVTCDAPVRDYNISLRVGLLFVILVTSALGVFMPILTTRFNLISQNNIIFTILKQFGTGIVISTAFVHLFTHADLMFGNQCLGELQYEGTTAAIFMAGLFLSFLVDYLGARFVAWRQAKAASSSTEAGAVATHDSKTSGVPSSNSSADVHMHAHSHGPLAANTPLGDKINVLNLEAGIIFHSILIGITLVVASDGFFITLFIVILFHQMFEGIALGTCIAELPAAAASTLSKCIMAGVFALITPIGMGIGIGVLKHFNGNDPSTIVAIGTLDALSAGILAWVGIVEMLARDWMGPRLMSASAVRTVCAMVGLVSGLVLMSVLGKWA